ncbi:MFS transporter [Microtetraspora malaysiensis]|uniref:MFS transporter n=1 Tax=Microtetraspora malaysiensis TaxID=161358 RepID=UPI003D919738
MAIVSPEDPALRLARAAAFAAVCVLVSAAGHIFAGGGPVAPGALLVGTFGSVVLAYALNGRERGPEVVLTATVGAQLFLHELFASTTPAPIPHHEDGHGHLGTGMVLAHLVVAVLTGWWLYRGESAVWLMLRLWGAPTFPVLRLLLTVPEETLRPVWQAVPASDPEPYGRREIAVSIHRRGPPMAHPAG